MAMARSIVPGMLRQSQCCYNDGDKMQDSVKKFDLQCSGTICAMQCYQHCNTWCTVVCQLSTTTSVQNHATMHCKISGHAARYCIAMKTNLASGHFSALQCNTLPVPVLRQWTFYALDNTLPVDKRRIFRSRPSRPMFWTC